MAAIKEETIDFLSSSAVTVDKTKMIKMHLFIYLLLLSFECTKSKTQEFPDVLAQLHKVSKRDQ